MIEAVDPCRVRAEDGVTFGLGQIGDQLFHYPDDLLVGPLRACTPATQCRRAADRDQRQDHLVGVGPQVVDAKSRHTEAAHTGPSGNRCSAIDASRSWAPPPGAGAPDIALARPAPER